MKDNLFEKLEKMIVKANSILLVGHAQPDQDAVGSVLAFRSYLLHLGKKISCYIPDSAPQYISFMPGSEDLISDSSILNKNWDLIIFFDCSSVDRAGMTQQDLFNKLTVVIDHHISNKGFAFLNIINPYTSSTCEIIYYYFLTINYPIDRTIATCLLAGILADTNGFSNAATNSQSILISSELIKKGVKIFQIIDYAMRNKSLNGLKLWGEVLSRLKVNKELNIAYTYIKDEDFRKFGVKEDELQGLANFLNVIVDVSAVAVFHIYSDKIKASWRTKRDDVDLAKFCQIFGGGGHQKAAGFTVNWQIIEKNGELMIV